MFILRYFVLKRGGERFCSLTTVLEQRIGDAIGLPVIFFIWLFWSKPALFSHKIYVKKVCSCQQLNCISFTFRLLRKFHSGMAEHKVNLATVMGCGAQKHVSLPRNFCPSSRFIRHLRKLNKITTCAVPNTTATALLLYTRLLQQISYCSVMTLNMMQFLTPGVLLLLVSCAAGERIDDQSPVQQLLEEVKNLRVEMKEYKVKFCFLLDSTLLFVYCW